MLDFRVGFPLALRNAHARVCRICGVSDVILFVPRTVLSKFFTRVLNALVSCYGVYLANFLYSAAVHSSFFIYRLVICTLTPGNTQIFVVWQT